MKDLIIIGTGVHCREMAQIVERVNRQTPQWNLLGFLAKSEEERKRTIEYPILGMLDDIARFPEAFFLPGWEWATDLPQDRLATVVDPSTFVAHSAQIGKGTLLYPNGFVGADAVIGDYVLTLSGAIINHDDVIGDHVVLASGVSLAGQVTVESGCYMGQACTVRQGLRIGAGSLIGMGAVVVKDVPPNSVMVGNPARLLRLRR